MIDAVCARKQLFVVLGMARSGTSALTRGLQALGIELGAQMMEANEAWNPKGFFEDKEIVGKINRGVLSALNNEGMTACLVDVPQDDAYITKLKQHACGLIKQRMEIVNFWAFKDPRTSRLLSFWSEVFASLDVTENYLIALRNPLASAYSYQRVTGCDIEEGLMLWIMHLVPAILGTQHKRRLVVSYEAMLQAPRKQLERIKQAFAIPDLTEQKEIDIYVNQFLDKKLSHFEYDFVDLQSHAAVKAVPFCVKLYALLGKVASDQINFASDEFEREWQLLMTEFDQLYPFYQYCNVLLERNKAVKKELIIMHRSLAWRLTYPLRTVKNFFRDKRKRKRSLKLLKEMS